MERKKPVIMENQVLVFSHSASPRLQYIVDLLTSYYGIGFKLVFDEHRYATADVKVKINYGYHRIAEDEIFIHSHVLLFETSIRPVKTECFDHGEFKAFFRAEGDTGFDLFAAIFFLVSRYEEYLPHQKDSYGRYAHENSVAFREGFLHLPLVNLWLEDFRKLLARKDPSFSTPVQGFRFLATYDIDMAWSYRQKGFKRNAGALLLLLLKFRFGQALNRISVIRGKREDPYDAYEWIDALHKEYKMDPVYFFLLAKKQSKYDRNIDINNAAFRQLVRRTADKYETGIHPSWQSGELPSLTGSERSCLEKITEKQVMKSRQHFIRFHLPDTYQQLISHGIEHEFSMGYGSINGFRASFTTPFFWYDLKNDKATGLMVHPFCFMDANAYYEQNLTAEEAYREMLDYLKIVREVRGTMITIWHNSFLGSSESFAGWKEIYRKFIHSVYRKHRS